MAISFALQRCPRIALLDIDEAGLEDTARECLAINPEVTLLRERYDARKEDEVKGAVDSVHDRFGRIDYAVNCAGSSSCFPRTQTGPPFLRRRWADRGGSHAQASWDR